MEVLGACQAKLLSCSSSPTAAKANIQLAIAMDPAGPQLQARDRRWLGTQNTQAGTQNTVGTRHTFVGTTNTLPGTENTIPGKKHHGNRKHHSGNWIHPTRFGALSTRERLERCGVGNLSNLGTGNFWSLASGNRCNLDNRDLRFAAGTSPLGTFATFLLRAFAAVWMIFSGSPCSYSALGQRSFDENRWSLLLGTFKTFWNLVDEKLWGHVACGTFGTLQRQGWHLANRDCCNFGTGSFRNFSIGNLEPIAIRNL